MKGINDIKFVFIMCMTIGLAPFIPEPHIFGKVKWLLGGAVGMQPGDWFDLIMHGIPWILLARILVLKGIKSLKTNPK